MLFLKSGSFINVKKMDKLKTGSKLLLQWWILVEHRIRVWILVMVHIVCFFYFLVDQKLRLYSDKLHVVRSWTGLSFGVSISEKRNPEIFAAHWINSVSSWLNFKLNKNWLSGHKHLQTFISCQSSNQTHPMLDNQLRLAGGNSTTYVRATLKTLHRVSAVLIPAAAL